MQNQTSVITNEAIVSYGFYDAGTGVAGLPNCDQLWVTVTPNHSGWMGQLAPPGSPQASKPFSKLCLPAAHDIGMNSMQWTGKKIGRISYLSGEFQKVLQSLKLFHRLWIIHTSPEDVKLIPLLSQTHFFKAALSSTSYHESIPLSPKLRT
jgi:hypothetical protein